MKTASKEVLVLVAASTFGLVMAMTLPQSAIAESGVSFEEISATFPVASTQNELVSSVDWSKVKQEPVSPTF